MDGGAAKSSSTSVVAEATGTSASNRAVKAGAHAHAHARPSTAPPLSQDRPSRSLRAFSSALGGASAKLGVPSAPHRRPRITDL